MGRYARKADDNQPEVVERFRLHGCSVAITHRLGGGFPDVVVALNGITALVEIKDGAKPPSARKLTADEREFAGGWQGWYEVVEGIDDVDALVGRMRRGWK